MPELECDIIMKGGITSGVIYPGVVSTLAEAYHFKSIGGTSAGAIAAAATAAAEYGRQHSNLDAFTQLASLPDDLGKEDETGNSLLFNFFQPQPKTRKLFDVFASSLRRAWTDKEGNKDPGRWRRVLFTAVRRYPITALVWTLPGVLLILASLTGAQSSYETFLQRTTIFLGVILAALLPLLLVTLVGLFSGIRGITRNNLGLVRGHADTPTPTALTDWFAVYLDKLAGLEPNTTPLTFGMLWGDGDDRNIDLQMMTTCVSLNVPYRLPFATREFYFLPSDFNGLFPAYVVRYLIGHGEAKEAGGQTYFSLPEALSLPVIVAMRLSLSFPILLSAVPLYIKEYNSQTFKRTWFSDGGISSNFPIHFFDRAVPTRPTFAINLRPYTKQDEAAGKPIVAMAESNAQGRQVLHQDIDTVAGKQRGAYGTIFAFLKNLLQSGFTWQDSLLSVTSGQRDRIVHVGLKKHADEGGLNLNMPASLIQELNDRGKDAGALIIKRFQPSPDATDAWNNHRWLRYRSFMAAMEALLLDFERGYTSTETGGGQSYTALIKRGKGEAPNSYRWANNSQQRFAEEETKELGDLAARWEHGEGFKKGASEDSPTLRASYDV